MCPAFRVPSWVVVKTPGRIDGEIQTVWQAKILGVGWYLSEKIPLTHGINSFLGRTPYAVCRHLWRKLQLLGRRTECRVVANQNSVTQKAEPDLVRLDQFYTRNSTRGPRTNAAEHGRPRAAQSAKFWGCRFRKSGKRHRIKSCSTIVTSPPRDPL